MYKIISALYKSKIFHISIIGFTILIYLILGYINIKVWNFIFNDEEVHCTKCNTEDNYSTINSMPEGFNPFDNTIFSEKKLIQAIYYYELYYPEWVLAQAKLESGNYKSKLFKEKNNLFGLYNSKNKTYYSFNHWSESVLAYKKMIQNPKRFDYKKDSDYPKYLQRINYAEDPDYINKLKTIKSKIKPINYTPIDYSGEAGV